MKKYIDHEDMINTNCSNVLEVIQKNNDISRKKITELTGLSWGGMTKIVNKLLEREYIIETKAAPTSKSGRIPSIISINNQKNYVIGLDINKIGFKGVVMNLSGEIIKNYSAKVLAQTKNQMLDEINAFTEMIFNDYSSETIIAIGVAMQGEVDSKKGISIKFPEIKDWNNVNLQEILSEKFKTLVFIEHDPDCLLYSQTTHRPLGNTLLFRIDSSIGMAVSLNGKILTGKGILEIAHNTVIPGGKLCSCGMKGCLEAYIPAFDTNSSAFKAFITPLSVTIRNTVNIFNADSVILTGNLIQYLKEYKDKFSNKLKSINCNVKIDFLENSDYAVMGVSLLAINKAINSLEI